MNVVPKNQSAPPLLYCPFAIFGNKEEEFRSIQFGESPTLSSFHLRPLEWCNNKEGTYECLVCWNPIVNTPFYSCKECDCGIQAPCFHRECIEPISKHPYHLKHSLRFIRCPWWEKCDKVCICCSNKKKNWVYDCAICDFTMCQDCVREPILLQIDHPKRHEHTLFYLPKKGLLICDVCGLTDQSSLMYSCIQCDFVVHRKCSSFPTIIRISRHEHRLTYNSSLTPENWLCGVCHRKIDTSYGRYSCVKGCNYGVHSKCATREDVWDGKELEGIPEDTYKTIKVFYEVGDGTIEHFGHQNHYMRLDEETNRAFDENKRCQACSLPIFDDIIYSCTQCDFILHQKCAYLPLRKQHAMHPHPLRLQVHLHHKKGWFVCKTCYRRSNGFSYLCYEMICDYELCVRCASIVEPLDQQYHPHPLFLTSDPQTKQKCSICYLSRGYRLNCGECSFVVCFRCATLPNKLRYKHDEHFLIFFYDEDTSCQYLCEVCEKEADPKNGIYMCNVCNVTVHIQCLLGKDMYMMPGGIFKLSKKNINILPNNRFTRNICRHCHNRCQEKIVYKISDIEMLCSYDCLEMWIVRYYL